MLTPRRSLALHAESGQPLPKVDDLQPFYDMGVTPRQGEVVMIAGRSGSQKSGFALWWTVSMNLPTLYFSADMSPFTASSRIACMKTGLSTDQVEQRMKYGGDKRQRILEQVKDVNLTFAFGQLSWPRVDEEIEAYVSLWDRYPLVVVFDNLMDFEGAESDYQLQMNVMSTATDFARETGATTVILHHASDKSMDALNAPFDPPGRKDIKNGLGEKPEQVWTVAIDNDTKEFKIACVKQRSGPSDHTGRHYAILRAEPELTRFHAY